MKQVEKFRWYLPPPAYKGPRAKPYLSSWHMTREEAAERGAVEPELHTRMLVDVPETAEEERALRAASDTSKLGRPR